MKNISHRSGSGFTIVELLLVIAIILILVALLMPALGRIRETAQNTKCISNMRQIYMATMIYAADYNGHAPFDRQMLNHEELFVQRSRDIGNSTYRDYYPQNKWFAEYLQSGETGSMNPVGYCPMGGRLGKIGAMGKGDLPNTSYGLNPDMFEDWWKDGSKGEGNWPIRCDTPLTQIEKPARVCLWIESNRSKAYKKDVQPSGRHFAKSKVAQTVVGEYPVYQYHGKANVVFVDGHLSWLSIPNEFPFYACYFWQPAKGNVCKAGQCDACDANVWNR